MIYGQLQYHHDEVKAWFKVIEFHKRELHELLAQLHLLLDFPLISLPVTKTTNVLIDQLMVQEQRFDHVRHHLEHQVQRFEHAITSNAELEPAVVSQQDGFRSKMKNHEIAFMKTKYECLIFIAGFFQPTPVLFNLG